MTPNVQTFINSFQNRLEPPVRQHLKNVYGSLVMTCGAACAGVYLDMYTWFQAGILSIIAGLVFVVLLVGTPATDKNTKLRLGYLLGVGLTTGMGLGPLLQFVAIVDPAIIVTALLCSTLVFVCFSIAAMLGERGSYLFLGAPLLTFMTSMSMLMLMNVFMRSYLLSQIYIYVGLFAMCGFVLYDTQLIIEKRRMGSKDFIQHALELFMDFVGMFRKLLIILTMKEENNRRRRRD